MAVRLMRSKGYIRLLEAGCGSGIFLVELARHCKRLDAVDVHDNLETVRDMIRLEGLTAGKIEIRHASVFSLPYEAGLFDGVVCMSVLEHFTTPASALRELARVAASDADIILGFPAKNLLTDLLFRFAGFNPNEIHPSSHVAILEAARRFFIVDEVTQFPAAGLPLYVVCRCHKPTA
jgi:2-polyprenyl-3-methyl-5-hydroxy-6-metoxy-1,4-benzoquinol methylase